MQKWNCRTGCGEVFFTTKIFNVHRPTCPNCQTRSTVEKEGEFEITERKKGPFKLGKR